MHHFIPTKINKQLYGAREKVEISSPLFLLHFCNRCRWISLGEFPWAQARGATHETQREDRHLCWAPRACWGTAACPAWTHIHSAGQAWPGFRLSKWSWVRYRSQKSTSAKVPLQKAPHFQTLQLGNALLNLCAYSHGTDMCHAWLLPSPLPGARRRYRLNTLNIVLGAVIKQSVHKQSNKVSCINNHFKGPCLLTVTT